MKNKRNVIITAALAFVLLLAGTAFVLGLGPFNFDNEPEIFVILPDAVPLAHMSDAQAMISSMVLTPVASGTRVDRNANAEIDFSNAADGYVMARWHGRNQGDVRVVIVGPSNTQFQYRLNTRGDWEVFPLTEGNGNYIIRVVESVGGGRFATTNTVRLDVTLVDEFAPFLRPNQFVNFNSTSAVVRQARELVNGSESTLESVGRVFGWVVDNIEYDVELARTVQSGFVPNLERVMRDRVGICFCYASLMTAMLRSQGIPTRLVIGYVSTNDGELYHAWISVFTEEYGWVNDIIRFDGNEWRIMDPTFAAGANQSADIIRFIGTGANHRAVRYN